MNKTVRAKIRVKIKSLAEEVVIIRKEMSRHKCWTQAVTQGSLQSHLDVVVRRELRHTLVAYGYLRGMPYRAIENTCAELPKASTIKRIIKSLSSEVVEIKEIEAWLAQV